MKYLTPVLSLFFACCITAAFAQKKFDIVITNARIIDGTGNPWYNGSVGIRKGKITRVGSFEYTRARKVIDAQGKVVTPGFIDVHAHAEGSIRQRPKAENFLYDGVTSIVTGNCGGSVLDMEEFFDEIEDVGISINVASLIGHNTIRRAAMGTDNRAPSASELEEMKNLVSKAMQAGAVGLSTGLIYVPGTFAATEEVIELARVSNRFGGVYASHIRNEDHRVFTAIDEAVAIGEASGVPVQISHFKISGKTSWGQSDKMIEKIEDWRQKGVDVTVDQYPYTASSTSLAVLVPTWALAGGTDSLNQRLSNVQVRSQIVEEMKSMLTSTGFDDFSYAVIARCPWDSTYNGKNMKEVTAMTGREDKIEEEIETIIEFVSKGPRVQMIYHKMNEDDVQRLMQYPLTMVARDAGIPSFGSGNPHPRSYGSCARVLGHYVRELQILRLEDAVRKMSSLPAQRFRLSDRGLLHPGKAADILVFDPNLVRSDATFDSSHAYSAGMEYVLVNGEIVIDQGKHNGTKHGKVLRNER